MSTPVITLEHATQFGLTTQIAMANQSPVTWSATDGVMAYNGIYTAPNRTRSVIVRATNAGGEQGTATISVTGDFIWLPSYGSFDYDLDKKGGFWVPESGPEHEQSRVKSPTFRPYRLGGDRPAWEIEPLEAFHDWHYLKARFRFVEPDSQIEYLARFDSKLTIKPSRVGMREWSTNLLLIKLWNA